ncbi:MAG TPA: hypothetical protein VGU21_02155, partial [Streptosporangiaceae bacterium]|nr:hypothetical protein [Streptosporangiaceae bacterium]
MSGSSKDQILARIRAANVSAGRAAPADAQAGPDAAYAALSREYLRAHHDPGTHDITGLFAERAADYRAVVERVPESGLPAAVARVLTARAASAPAASAPAASAFAPAVSAPAGLPAATFVV